jgi:hypothetical protein
MKEKIFCFFLILIGITGIEAQFSRTDNQTERKLVELARLVAPISRKPSKEELKAVEPSRELEKKIRRSFASIRHRTNTTDQRQRLLG